MNKMRQSLRTSLCILSLLLPAASLSSASDDPLGDAKDIQGEIGRTLAEVVLHADSFRGSPASVSESKDLENDLARLKSMFERMDFALGNFPCDTAAPGPPDTQAAFEALHGDPLDQQRAVLEKDIDSLKQEKRFAERVHTISVDVLRMKLMAIQVDSLMRVLPLDNISTFLAIVDDITNMSQPGEVKRWPGSVEYHLYVDHHKDSLYQRVADKYRLMGKVGKNAKINTDLPEFKLILSQAVKEQTAEDIRNVEQEIPKKETQLAGIKQSNLDKNLRNAYFETLRKALAKTLSESQWITNPAQFKKDKASISVLVVDDATRRPIPNVQVRISPASGSASPGTNGARFDGVSASADPYTLEGAAKDYAGNAISVTVSECTGYASVIPLKKNVVIVQPAPAPAPVSNSNHPPEVRLEADTTSGTDGVIIHLFARASDPDDDPLQYSWSSQAGSIAGEDAEVQLQTAGVNSTLGAAPVIISVTVTVSDGRGGTASSSIAITVNAPTGLRAQLTCGSALEIVPGEIDRSCGVVVKGWRGNTTDRVEVIFPQLQEDGQTLPGKITVFPGNTSAAPGNMFTAGISDYHDQYEFSFHFAAASDAPHGSVPIQIIVRQKGAGETQLALTVNVLSKGQIAVPGMGNPPPVIQGGGGDMCVWRYKLLSETRAPCWHFVANTCKNARYNNPHNGYILAGANMSRKDADDLITAQSQYYGGCDTQEGNNQLSQAAAQQCRDIAAQIQQLLSQCDIQKARGLLDQFKSQNCDQASSATGKTSSDLERMIGKAEDSVSQTRNLMEEARTARNMHNLTWASQSAEQALQVAPACLSEEAQSLVNEIQQSSNRTSGLLQRAQDALNECQGDQALHILSSVDRAQLSPQDQEQFDSMSSQASDVVKAHTLVLQVQKDLGDSPDPGACQGALQKLSQTANAAGGCDSDLISQLSSRASECPQPSARTQELDALRQNLEGWQKALDCLEEGKRKIPNYWQDCNGNWTMGSRDVAIDHLRKLVADARVKLGLPPLDSPSTSASGSPNELETLRKNLDNWQKSLDCLEEGKRKFPNHWQDCNGNWTMGSRDVAIDHFRKLIGDAHVKLGLPPLNPPATNTTTTTSTGTGTPTVSKNGPATNANANRGGIEFMQFLRFYGDALWYTPPSGTERPLQKQDAIRAGSTVRTGGASQVSVKSPGGTTVTVNQNSGVRMPVENGGKAKTVELLHGSVEVHHPEGEPGFDDVIISSPGGTAHGLGTRYRVELTSTGTLVQVFEGFVQLKGAYITRVAAPGQEIGKPSPVKELALQAGQRALMIGGSASTAGSRPPDDLSSDLPSWMKSGNGPGSPPSPLAQVDPWNNSHVQQLMDQWVHAAIPASKTPGVVMHYNEWLQPLSQGAKSTGPPAHPADWTRYRYLWENRWRYDSANLCTLGSFLEQNLGGKDSKGCGTSLPSWMTAPGGQRAAPPSSTRPEQNVKVAQPPAVPEGKQKSSAANPSAPPPPSTKSVRGSDTSLLERLSGPWTCQVRVTDIQVPSNDISIAKDGSAGTAKIWITRSREGYLIDYDQMNMKIPNTYVRGNAVGFGESFTSLNGKSLGGTLTIALDWQFDRGLLTGPGRMTGSDGSRILFSTSCSSLIKGPAK